MVNLTESDGRSRFTVFDDFRRSLPFSLLKFETDC